MKFSTHHSGVSLVMSMSLLVFSLVFTTNAILPDYLSLQSDFEFEMTEGSEEESEEEQEERSEWDGEEALLFVSSPCGSNWASMNNRLSIDASRLHRCCAEVLTPPPERS